MNLYREESSNAKWNAQRNLCGRTHYVDDDTLRFHKSRVLSSRKVGAGLLFYIVESAAADMHNTRRIFRGVVFDVFGTTLYCPSLDDSFATRKAADKAMWAAINAIDEQAVTLKAIERQREHHDQECDRLRAEVLALRQKEAA